MCRAGLSRYNAGMSLIQRSFADRVGQLLGRPAAEFRVLALCLAALHVVMVQGPEDVVGRLLMLVHLGFFLLWQPVVRGAYRLGWVNSLAMIGGIAAMFLSLSWGLLAVWLITLASAVSGAAFVSEPGRPRLPYRFALAYLVASLLIVVVPHLVPVARDVSALFDWLSLLLLPALLAGVALGRPGSSHARTRGIDFVSAALLFLVLTVMVLGALVAMWLMALPYLVAIVFALFATAGSLVVMAWAWDPHLGGPQLGAQFARRLLSAGMSFEEWLHEVASLAVANDDPEAFLEAACRQMLQLPGVRGGRWQVPEGEGSFGRLEGVERVKRSAPLQLNLFLARAPSAAMDWHLDLTIRLLGQFYLEKRHARELESLSYVRAVHETGARLTHDVKNLLQSLNTLCFTATQPQTDATTLKALVGRQLPVITSRLAATMEKLRVPSQAESPFVPVETWWRQAKERHAGSPVRFEGDPAGVEVPATLFDTALDNLVQNALDKRAHNPKVAVQVASGLTDGHLWLEVTDSGHALDPRLRSRLFLQRVPSDNGLGMGLYQLARQAEALGYRVELVNAEAGSVCFRLASG